MNTMRRSVQAFEFEALFASKFSPTTIPNFGVLAGVPYIDIIDIFSLDDAMLDRVTAPSLAGILVAAQRLWESGDEDSLSGGADADLQPWDDMATPSRNYARRTIKRTSGSMGTSRSHNPCDR